MDHYRFPLPRPLRTQEMFPLDNQFDVPRWRWLAWIMRKLGLLKQTYYYAMVDHGIETIEVSGTDVKDFIYKVLSKLRAEGQPKPKKIYVGRDFHRELMKSAMWRELPLDIKELRFAGIHIVISPYLDGIMPTWE